MGAIAQGPLHWIAAAFTCGREDVIPDMVQRLIHQLVACAPARWVKSSYYLEGRIEADGDRHGPLAQRLI